MAFATPTPWKLDAPIPADFGKRTFLDSGQVAGYRDKLETLIGYWGVLENGTVTISSSRPASFIAAGATTPPVVKIVLQKSDPVYSSILTKSTGINAALVVLNFTWGSNEKGQITITDTAQFVVDRLPTDADYAAVGTLPSGSQKKLVYVEAALLSLVQTSVLKNRSFGANLLYQVFNIGGTNYANEEGTNSSFIVTLGVRRRLCEELGNCISGATPQTVAGLNGTQLQNLEQSLKSMKASGGIDFTKSGAALDQKKQPNALALAPVNKSLKVRISSKSIGELLK